MMKLWTTVVAVFTFAAASPGAEIFRLTAANYAASIPAGKEVDAAIGDYVLRSDRLIAVVADPVEGRNANLTVKAVGGHLLDLTRRDAPNDQLSAWYAAPSVYALGRATIESTGGAQAVLVCQGVGLLGQPDVTVRYTIQDGRDDLLIQTTIRNVGDAALTFEPADDVRADKIFAPGAEPDGAMAWVHDEWWWQAYGVINDPIGRAVTTVKGTRPRFAYGPKATIAPGADATFSRRLLCAANVLELRSRAATMLGKTVHPVSLRVVDPDGPVAGAVVMIGDAKLPYGTGATDAAGRLAFTIAPGEHPYRVVAQGRPVQRGTLKASAAGAAVIDVALQSPGYIVGRVTDEHGGPIPCKVVLKALDGADDPMFFNDTGEFAVHNILYSPDGVFRQAIAPGRYEATISRGPEYDAETTTVLVERGKAAVLAARLRRTVNTPGWISGEFHSHSSPSGDNVSSQLGRVLNLLAEHLEYAPCTEHQRIDSYTPHLQRLKAEHLMATCTGLELTNQLPFNHQNVFPLIHKPGMPGGGAPAIDDDPATQIQRLAYWDDRSEKLVQQNHPNLMQLAYDSDTDGKRDSRFAGAFQFMDVIEVHPIHTILDKPGIKDGVSSGSNRVAAWLQLLNQGLRIPGVVNTDAHYNAHGSGWLRNYVASPTDDPARIRTLDVVRACEKGHVVMSTGPFMEVTLSGNDSTAIPGDELKYDGQQAMLHVKVQCPNWMDINRVQVLLNGRADPKLNFTRTSHAKFFADGPVKFDRNISMKFDKDAHVIVVALGEGLTLSKGYPAGTGQKMPPCAVSNPIYVDADGDGFKSNGDELDAPLPR